MGGEDCSIHLLFFPYTHNFLPKAHSRLALNRISIFFLFLNIVIRPVPIKSHFETCVLQYFTFTRYKDNHQDTYIDLQLSQKTQ